MTPPSNAPKRIVGSGGIFLYAIYRTTTSGISANKEILKLPLSVTINACSVSLSAWVSVPSPTMAKRNSAIVNEGPVVHAMWRMCVNISVSTTAGARFVVSESGDILSPK